MDKNNIYEFVLLILCLLMTAALFLMLANIQFVNWRIEKIEIEIYPFENGVKIECSYEYPGYGDYKFKDEEFINLFDALKIQPEDTITINMEDLEVEILDKFGYLLGERKGDGDEIPAIAV